MTDNFTIDPILEEKARWFDKLHELGFVFDRNDETQTELSYWYHKDIGTLKARLMGEIDTSSEYYGRFMVILTVLTPINMGPDMNFGAGSTKRLQQVYDALMYVKNLKDL